jgi:hypothetical protein
MHERRGANGPPAEPGAVSPWALAGLGIQFAVALVLFGYAGQWVDQRLNSAPVGLLTGVLVGAGGTFYLSIRRLTAPRKAATPPDEETRQP